MSNMLKVNWQDEELDIYYRKNGYPKSVWQDNEGKPFGIYGYASQEDMDNGYDVVDVEWFATEQERDTFYKESKVWVKYLENGLILLTRTVKSG